MAKFLNTFWAFLLHVLGISVFQTCFTNAMKDLNGKPLLYGQTLTSVLFASAIYVIILKINLFPNTFRKPQIALLSLYEFLATMFLLEFSLACIWIPIDVIIMKTLPKKLCEVFHKLGYLKLAEIINTSNNFVDILCLFIALTFFYLSLHVTRTLDFSILKKQGVICFLTHFVTVIWNRIIKEFPSIKHSEKQQIKNRRRRKSRESRTSFTECH
ncbi:uncharacterized protein LOC127280096 [Leptopilina boulardi]|uniref:uncharacterized protein LOC127280096 n=1 Tax=Leptopilina boulardi TaxID=63433 RepID=UPI0021F5A47F|nr:uncharacterized protein LOC127280096 [Leptopilina boulardi]